jgi:hypothetical protein
VIFISFFNFPVALSAIIKLNQQITLRYMHQQLDSVLR